MIFAWRKSMTSWLMYFSDICCEIAMSRIWRGACPSCSARSSRIRTPYRPFVEIFIRNRLLV